MITLHEYTNYFRKIAEKHKLISGFLKLSTKDLGEAGTAIRNGKFAPFTNVLVLENFEIGQKAANSDQCFDFATGLFSIFQPYDVRGIYDLDAIGDETLMICRQIEARMWHDVGQRQYDFIKQLQPGSFEFEPCHAPILNMFGWRVFFEFAANNPIEYGAEDWDD